jgi:hypothetical protein
MKITSLCFFIFLTSVLTAQTRNWVPLTQEVNSYIGTLNVFKGELVAGGYITRAGNTKVHSIASWNGNRWDDMGGGMPGSSDIWATLVTDSFLYAVGMFDSAGNVPAKNIAKWDGNNWSAVGTGPNKFVTAIAKYKGDIIIAGDFDSVDGIPGSRIARWDGAAWYPMPGLVSSSNIHRLYVYNNEVYALGWIDSAGGVAANYIARWNGTAWNNVSNGVSYGTIAMIEWRGKLLIAGVQLNQSNFDEVILQWDGSSLTTFSETIYSIRNFYIYNNELYHSGGGQTVPGGHPIVFKWDSLAAKWLPVGTGLNTYGEALVEYKGDLYCSGGFNKYEYCSINYIARYKDITGIILPESISSIEIFPNPFVKTISIKGSGIRQANVLTMAGQLVKKEFFDEKVDPVINLESIASGFYIIEIIRDDRSVARRKIYRK